MNQLMPFVFILVAIGLFFGYVRPEWTGAIAQSKSEIASYNSALDAAASFTSEEAQLEDQRNAIPSDQLNRLGAFLPDGVDNIQLIIDLNSLATRSGVSLSNFTTSQVPNQGNNSSQTESQTTDASGSSFAPSSLVDSLTISVSATGTYDSFRSFLAGLEQSLRPLDVVSLSVSDSETGVYTYTMTLKFYWLH